MWPSLQGQIPWEERAWLQKEHLQTMNMIVIIITNDKCATMVRNLYILYFNSSASSGRAVSSSSSQRGDTEIPRMSSVCGQGLHGIPGRSSESTFSQLPGDFPPIWAQEQKYFLGSLFLLTIPDWARLENLTNFRKCIYRRECREAGSQGPHRS